MNRERDGGRTPAVSSTSSDVYETALRSMADAGAHRQWFIRARSGHRFPLGADLRRWCGTADGTDRTLLARSCGAVLDVGCGPGRLVAALHQAGRQAVGLDTSVVAVALTRRSGGAALQRSVFDPLPGEGRWDSVLLADGNVGIGGDPVALLDRCRELVTGDGRVLVELAAPGTGLRVDRVRMERSGETGEWFDWARVGDDAADEVAATAGLRVTDRWQHGDRRFATLRPDRSAAGTGAALGLAS